MKKILVIDDIKENLITIEAVINNSMPNCRVLTALSGKEGLKIAREEQPDTILLDIIMPQMDGYEVCKRLKENDASKHIPIIMLTAIKTDIKSKIKGLEAGADVFFTKPIEPNELSAQINVMLRIKEAEDKLRAERELLDEKVKIRTEELRENEEKYRSLTEHLNVGVYRNTIGAKGRFIEANPAIVEMFGYKKKNEFLKLNVADLYKNPGERKNFSEKMISKGFVRNEEIQLQKSDGTFFFGSVSAMAVKDEKGKVKYYDGIIEDITDHRLVEEALKESEKKYRLLAETAKDIIMVLDLKGNVKYINQEGVNLSGYSKNESLKMKINDILPEDKISLSDNKFAKRIAGDKSLFMYEIDFFNKNGDKIPVEIKSSLITEHGKPSGVLIIARDITERKRSQEKEKEHHKNIELLSKTAMRFVEFPQDKDIYHFIGEQLQEFVGKDSYVVVNSVDTEKNILTTRTVLGMGKLSEKVASLLGKHPVGMNFNAKDKYLVSLSDGKLHLYKEGLYGILLKTVPKVVCNSIEKLLNIKTIYGIGFTKDNELFGTIIIFIKEVAGELKNKQIIEAFLKQASIAIQKRQAEEELKKYREHLEELVKERTKELEEKNEKLKQYNQLFEGREFRIKDLKDRVKELEERLGIRED